MTIAIAGADFRVPAIGPERAFRLNGENRCLSLQAAVGGLKSEVERAADFEVEMMSSISPPWSGYSFSPWSTVGMAEVDAISEFLRLPVSTGIRPPAATDVRTLFATICAASRNTASWRAFSCVAHSDTWAAKDWFSAISGPASARIPRRSRSCIRRGSGSR